MSNYPESMAEETWQNGDLKFSIVKTHMGHYCGYVRFPKRPLIAEGYHGFATYVPVHGGLTYAEEDDDQSMVYGFDCAHSGDEVNLNCRNVNWLKAECERMAQGIKIAVGYEQQYLLARNNDDKAQAIDQYHKQLETDGITFRVQDNFGVMLNVLAGEL